MMHFTSKVAAVLLLSNFAPVEAESQQRTDWGVRSVPGSGEQQSSNARVKSGRTFACSVASVTDGDTFRCTDGTRIRLSAIDTAEMPGACRPGRTCAPGNPHVAKAALSRLISGRTVQCEPAGNSYNRVAAWCSVSGQDLSCAMVRSGHAIRLPQHDRQKRLCR
jgi:endonuclease YncB( thermonuclease family)